MTHDQVVQKLDQRGLQLLAMRVHRYDRDVRMRFARTPTLSSFEVLLAQLRTAFPRMRLVACKPRGKDLWVQIRL